MLLTCNSDVGVMGVSDVDIVLRDNGSASANEGAALRKSQTKVCSSIESSGPRCEVLFSGLEPAPHNLRDRAYSGVVVSISVAHTDFSDEDEYISGVTVGGLHFVASPASGRRFMSHGRDNDCTLHICR